MFDTVWLPRWLFGFVFRYRHQKQSNFLAIAMRNPETVAQKYTNFESAFEQCTRPVLMQKMTGM